jgi:hypothetical protein
MEVQEILRFGVVFVGLVLIIGALNNLHTGYTFGLTGKGKFFRKDEPRHFMILCLSRIFLGLACLGAAYLVPA